MLWLDLIYEVFSNLSESMVLNTPCNREYVLVVQHLHQNKLYKPLLFLKKASNIKAANQWTLGQLFWRLGSIRSDLKSSRHWCTCDFCGDDSTNGYHGKIICVQIKFVSKSWLTQVFKLGETGTLNSNAILEDFEILEQLLNKENAHLKCIYRSSKLLLCDNSEIWSRKHGCNSLSKYCQFPEWRCTYFYHNIYHVSISTKYYFGTISDGGAFTKIFSDIFIFALFCKQIEWDHLIIRNSHNVLLKRVI